MGTVGSYSGDGSPESEDLRQTITDWLDKLPRAAPLEAPAGGPGPDQLAPPRQPLDPAALLSAVGLLRPRRPSGGGSDGPGGGGGQTGGGTGRSAAASAKTAGRAAAGARAYATGDTDTLARLGVSYTELRALGDPMEVVRRIVSAAVESQPNSGITDHEQRLFAADIADWVITESEAGSAPSDEDIVRRSIAGVIAQVTLVETGDLATAHEQGALTEEEIHEAAEILASRAELSANGATEEEFSRAIEDGIERLRAMTEGGQ